MRVLVVEDEPVVAEALAFLMRGDGYEVDVADSGPQGLDTFRLRRPDLVLLDLMLPGCNGLQVCRTIRGASDVPIIIITARSAEAEKVVGLEAGADDYLTKPFSMAELMARVHAIMRRRGTATAVEPFQVGPVPAPRPRPGGQRTP